MRNKIITLGIAALLVIMSAATASAQAPRRGPEFRAKRAAQEKAEPGPREPFWKHADLGLSEEQIEKLEGLRSEFQKNRAKQQNQLKIKRLELRGLLLEDDPSEKKLYSKVEEISKLQMELQKKRIAHLLEVRKILTPEQWTKFSAHRGHRGPGKGGPRGARRGPGRGGCPER